VPGGKRYKPVVSQQQRKFLFAAAARGELPYHEAYGKSKAAKGRKLPRRVRGGRKRR